MKKRLSIISFVFLWQAYGLAQWVNNEQISVSNNTIVFSNESLVNQVAGNFVNDGSLYLANDLQNDGLFSFTPNLNGITYFQGVNQQQIGGKQAIALNRSVFDNANGFNLTNTLNFHQDATFNQGVLLAQPNLGIPLFETNATVLQANNSSHIIGRTFKKGTSDFEFPIGRGTRYRSAKISGIKLDNQIYSGQFFEANSNELYPHANKVGVIKEISTTEYWEVSNTVGTHPVVLTLSYENANVSDPLIRAPLEALRIVRWDDSSKKWLDEGGIIDKDNKTITTPYEVTGFGIFALGRTDDKGIISPCNKLAIYNYVSLNEDGLNDFFRIDGLVECGLPNTVEIFNRWGRKIYSTQNYGSANNIFKGVANSSSKDSNNELLPSGTYYYILKIGDSFSKSGYLFLN